MIHSGSVTEGSGVSGGQMGEDLHVPLHVDSRKGGRLVADHGQTPSGEEMISVQDQGSKGGMGRWASLRAGDRAFHGSAIPRPIRERWGILGEMHASPHSGCR